VAEQVFDREGAVEYFTILGDEHRRVKLREVCYLAVKERSLISVYHGCHAVLKSIPTSWHSPCDTVGLPAGTDRQRTATFHRYVRDTLARPPNALSKGHQAAF